MPNLFSLSDTTPINEGDTLGSGSPGLEKVSREPYVPTLTQGILTDTQAQEAGSVKTRDERTPELDKFLKSGISFGPVDWTLALLGGPQAAQALRASKIDQVFKPILKEYLTESGKALNSGDLDYADSLNSKFSQISGIYPIATDLLKSQVEKVNSARQNIGAGTTLLNVARAQVPDSDKATHRVLDTLEKGLATTPPRQLQDALTKLVPTILNKGNLAVRQNFAGETVGINSIPQEFSSKNLSPDVISGYTQALASGNFKYHKNITDIEDTANDLKADKPIRQSRVDEFRQLQDLAQNIGGVIARGQSKVGQLPLAEKGFPAPLLQPQQGAQQPLQPVQQQPGVSTQVQPQTGLQGQSQPSTALPTQQNGIGNYVLDIRKNDGSTQTIPIPKSYGSDPKLTADLNTLFQRSGITPLGKPRSVETASTENIPQVLPTTDSSFNTNNSSNVQSIFPPDIQHNVNDTPAQTIQKNESQKSFLAIYAQNKGKSLTEIVPPTATIFKYDADTQKASFIPSGTTYGDITGKGYAQYNAPATAKPLQVLVPTLQGQIKKALTDLAALPQGEKWPTWYGGLWDTTLRALASGIPIPKVGSLSLGTGILSDSQEKVFTDLAALQQSFESFANTTGTDNASIGAVKKQLYGLFSSPKDMDRGVRTIAGLVDATMQSIAEGTPGALTHSGGKPDIANITLGLTPLEQKGIKDWKNTLPNLKLEKSPNILPPVINTFIDDMLGAFPNSQQLKAAIVNRLEAFSPQELEGLPKEDIMKVVREQIQVSFPKPQRKLTVREAIDPTVYRKLQGINE